jgi:hypothetical protein
MLDIEALTEDLPSSVICPIKYETFCEDPEGTLRGICHFVGLEYTPAMLVRGGGIQHHIGGSPSKFDDARRAIELDTSYLAAFDAVELRRLSSLVGEVGKRWGY